jgi:hypothetical protein
LLFLPFEVKIFSSETCSDIPGLCKCRMNKVKTTSVKGRGNV